MLFHMSHHRAANKMQQYCPFVSLCNLIDRGYIGILLHFACYKTSTNKRLNSQLISCNLTVASCALHK